MLREETTFQETRIEEAGLLPSVTFCQRRTHQPSGLIPESMEEAFAIINNYKKDVNAYLEFTPFNITELDNASALADFNAKPEDVWNYGFRPFYDSKNLYLEPCATISLDTLKLNQLRTSFRIILASGIGNKNYRMEIHSHGQSNHNYKENYLEGLKYVTAQKGFQIAAGTVETTSLKRANYDCYEDNSMKKAECINEFIEFELGCKLPWLETSLNFEYCSGSEVMSSYLNLYEVILTNNSMISHCLKPNCVKITWIESYVSTWEYKVQKKKISTVAFHLPSNSYTIKRKELFLFTFSTFLADVGSYLGLFLGTSVLSLTDQIDNMFHKLKKKLLEKKKKPKVVQILLEKKKKSKAVEKLDLAEKVV